MDIEINLHFDIGDYIEGIGTVTSYEMNPNLNFIGSNLSREYCNIRDTLITINFTGSYISRIYVILFITRTGEGFNYGVNYLNYEVFYDGPEKDLVTVQIPCIDNFNMNLME